MTETADPDATMKLLLINPNTLESMTELVVRTAKAVAAPSTEIIGATGRFGARYISTRAASAIATHAALDAYAEYGTDADVVGISCFGDPGLNGLKELAQQPVIGMAEAACIEAARDGRRFAIVTGGERWGPMLEEFVAALGLSANLACVMTVAPTGADIARDPDAAYQLLADAANRCVKENRADVVILGGAGLAGIADHLQPRVSRPLIDSVKALVTAAEHLGRTRPKKPTTGSFAPTTPVETVGLSPRLAALMEGRTHTA